MILSDIYAIFTPHLMIYICLAGISTDQLAGVQIVKYKSFLSSGFFRLETLWDLFVCFVFVFFFSIKRAIVVKKI